MRVYELMPLFNEIDLLRLHLMEMDPVVDVWGICELPVTFTGLPKPLTYDPGKLAPWAEKVRYFVPPAYPEGGHPMVDWFQRRALVRAIHDAEPEDLIILTDLDEIPNPSVIKRLREHPPSHPVSLETKLYYYDLQWRDPVPWLGPVVAPRRSLGADPDLQRLRDLRGKFPRIQDGGWHFSWYGDGPRILEKLRAVDIVKENEIYGSDGIEPPPARLEYVEECLREGKDLFGRQNRPKKRVEITPGDGHPNSVFAWLQESKSSL